MAEDRFVSNIGQKRGDPAGEGGNVDKMDVRQGNGPGAAGKGRKMELTIEELLQKPYWVIDIFPGQVPMDSPGQFFAVEKYFLEKERLAEIKRKHIDLVLKLNCYRSITLDEETEADPPPERIAEEMRRRYVCIRTGGSLIISEPDDTHMTVFAPDEKLLELIKALAAGEGLFVWQPPGCGPAAREA